ncbi:acyltransferase family protein [Bulleidia sp. HCP3S3_F2]|uniref:acyltransferase family protein n=1 Tax=unclassified Bulleidia TaxID=2704656 RepID=UPI003F8C0DA3
MKKERESGIELYKVIAIFLIVLSHVIQTLTEPNYVLGIGEGTFINIATATTDLYVLLLALFRICGALGNNMFFICSAWFLVNSKKMSLKKVIHMVLDVWIINMIVFWGLHAIGIQFQISDTVRTFFPTTFANNWYITCYLLFYLIHPFLNRMLEQLNISEHFALTSFLFMIYFIIPVLPLEEINLFFANELVIFLATYVIVSFIKTYKNEWTENLKLNKGILFVSIVSYVVLILSVDYLGLRTNYFLNRLVRWNMNNSLFMFLIAFSSFNMMKKKKFINRTINYFSSLSLLVYIFHENLAFRRYFRPVIEFSILRRFGIEHAFICAVFMAVSLAILSFIISAIYKIFFTKIVSKLSSIISQNIQTLWKKYERLVIEE